MTSGSPFEENTLGVVVGRAAKRAVSSTGRWLNTASAREGTSLGLAFLELGTAIIVGLRAVYGLVWFAGLWTVYPTPYPALAAWVVLAAVLVATIVSARVIGDRMPNWMLAIFLAGIAGAVALDIVAVWDLHDIGRYATAALTAGVALLVLVPLRGPATVFAAAGTLGLALGLLVFLDALPGVLPDPDWLAAQLTAIALSVLPALIGVVVVSGFRRMVQVELDRVMVGSNVSAPRFAVGMLASEELARLDKAAEDLFQSIADGAQPLPLAPKVASVAASLATELRLHLIEGRRETWLYHAVSESELLGKSVTLIDKSALAGLLDARQRDGLLSAAWLLVTDSARQNRTATLQVGPVDPSAVAPDHKLVIPITITTTGTPRNRVDPAVWDALGRVGKHTETTQDSSLKVELECVVDNPADTTA